MLKKAYNKILSNEERVIMALVKTWVARVDINIHEKNKNVK